MVVAHGGHASHEHGRTWVWYAAAGLLLAGVIFVVADLLISLHVMTTELGSVSQHISALDAMNRKLDGIAAMQQRLDSVDAHLTGMQRTLVQTNVKLDTTNGHLVTAIGQLSSTQSKLGDMDGQLKGMSGEMRGVGSSLTAMRGDIHTMVHKIDGSFLFRGVK
jgi:ABC-type transporter Mla subunit MlaD